MRLSRRGAIHAGRQHAAAGGDYATEVAADGPVSWYRLSETSGSTVADEAGTIDLTVYGANLNVSGPAATGSAASFDGTDDYMDGTTRPNITTAYTLEALIYSSSTGAQHTVGSYGAGEGERGYSLLAGNVGGRRLRVFHGAPDDAFLIAAVSNVDLPSNVWTHIAATWSTTDDAGQVRLFINGVETGYDSRVAKTTSINNGGNVARLGAYLTGNGVPTGFFDGRLDEPAIYDKVLTPARILVHAQAAGVA